MSEKYYKRIFAFYEEGEDSEWHEDKPCDEAVEYMRIDLFDAQSATIAMLVEACEACRPVLESVIEDDIPLTPLAQTASERVEAAIAKAKETT